MQTFLNAFLIIGITFLGTAQACADDEHAGHSDEDGHHEEEKGPHGGKLLEDGDLAVELKIHEQGVAPEYRAWVELGGRPVTDKDLDMSLELTRLGGEVDTFDFSWQGEYWRGEGVVEEPHSFDARLTLDLDGEHYEWSWESHEGRTHIDSELAREAGIESAVAAPGTIRSTLTAYGRLVTAPDQVADIRARFPGLVTKVNVSLGEEVTAGDVLAEIESNESLQKYSVRAAINGTITARQINTGEVAGDRVLFSIVNLDSLWAELKVFPGQRAQLKVGQAVILNAEGIEQKTEIRHFLPDPTNAPYVLARSKVDNAAALLSPGLFVAGEIVVEEVDVPLVVDNRGLQSFRDSTGVFIQVGDTYEFRPLDLGRSDSRFTEVLSGLEAGERYVVEQSFLIKADLEKSAASHHH
jgi:cobalt-zinc-cadmium efflux system membrane fusion protein